MERFIREEEKEFPITLWQQKLAAVFLLNGTKYWWSVPLALICSQQTATFIRPGHCESIPKNVDKYIWLILN